MRLSIQAIYEAARAAGFTPDQATTWTAIALAESGGETGALNDSGEHSVGLWQINVASGVRSNTWGNLNDPAVNARAAYEISRQGTDMRPWTTTHASHAGSASDYRTYLGEVSAVTGYAGDPRGVEGYGSALLDPLPPSAPEPLATTSTYDQIDLGMDPDSRLDTDKDGLTDAFELLTGSSPDVADTDQDGLSDAYEAVVSQSNPLLADTDRDGLPDSTEAALGTSANQWDSDTDGASDGVEVEYGSDPLHAENGVVTPAAEPVTTPVQAAFAQPVAPVGQTTPGSPVAAAAAAPSGGTRADAFVAAAEAQRGDTYVFGAETSLDDADPDSWDCSELTQWAAHQAGVTIPDGAMYQYLELKGEDQLMSVDEALQTKGALLFYFSSEPTAGGGRPSTAHVAISLGDGRTIEARGSSYGVNEFPAAGRFNYAGVIPEMADPGAAGAAGVAGTAVQSPATYDLDGGLPIDGTLDSDGDGLSDAFEQMIGFDPLSADTDSDGMGDALEYLGSGGGATTAARVATPTPTEVAAALAAQGLDAQGDEDQDGLSNRYEVKHGLDAASADTDSDGLTDSAEVALGTDPTAVDSDADGLTDRVELELGTDPLQHGTPQDQWGLLDDGAPDPGPDPLDGPDLEVDLG